MMKPEDQRVVAAMGSRFAQLQRLAIKAKTHPHTRAHIEREMGVILLGMTPEERTELRRALIEAGAYVKKENE